MIRRQLSSDYVLSGDFMKILFISLGCDKNLSDSEEMLGLLTANGHGRCYGD